MDDGSLMNLPYYEPPIKGHLMSSGVDRPAKPFVLIRDNPVMVSANGAYHPQDCMVSESRYVKDSWFNHREKFLQMFPRNPPPYNYVIAEAPGAHRSMHMVHQSRATKESKTGMEKPVVKTEDDPRKKRAAGATLKAKKPRKTRAASKENGNLLDERAKTSKRNVEVVIKGMDMDIISIPIPVCSCTGTSRKCYRWGCGGWQSACCTTTVSMYPLPMSTKRRGTRIAGRKMSQGAFKKLLEKLVTEGYHFCNPIDLRPYWAKHGTNKFVVIQ